MKRLVQPFILGLFISLVLISCKKEKEKIEEEIKKEILNAVPNEVSAKFDGTAIEFHSEAVGKSSTDSRLWISGYRTSGSAFPVLSVNLADTMQENKSYIITASNFQGIPNVEYAISQDSSLYLYSGQITLNSLSTAEKVMTGTFNGILKPSASSTESITVTEGSFSGKW